MSVSVAVAVSIAVAIFLFAFGELTNIDIIATETAIDYCLC